MFHLITGGSGSGKSAYAEACIQEFGGKNRIYIATMFPFDEESHKRIGRHRRMRRDKAFTTVECYTGIAGLSIPRGSDVLLECMSNLVANEMYQEQGAGIRTVEAVLEGAARLAAQAANLVVVTNEVFSDGIVYDPDTRRYLENLGTVNRRLAEMADRVTEVVYGIPVLLKTERKGEMRA